MAELEDARKNIKKTKAWSASMYKYLKKTVKKLEELKGKKEDKGLYNEAYRALRYARRSEGKLNNVYAEAKDNLEKLKSILPSDSRTGLENIEKELEPNEAVLIKEASFYTGTLKDHFEEIGPQLDLFKKGKAEESGVNELISDVVQEIKDIIAEPGLGQKAKPGLVPFIAALEKLDNKLKEIAP